MPYARGKRSKAISDRSGQAFPYREMVKEWNGSLVHISEFEAKHPQLDPPYHKADPIALLNTRSQDFQQPETVNGAVASSGGQGMITANLSLPGDFAFQTTRAAIISTDNVTSVRSMVPKDPAEENRKREAKVSIGLITVSIT